MNQRPVGRPERATQNDVVAFFQRELGYTYLGNRHKREGNSNIEKDALVNFLRGRYADNLIEKAYQKLLQTANDPSKPLADVNKEVYRLLRYGVNVQPDIGMTHETVLLIDWKHPTANHFGIAEEVSLRGEHNKRPDIVLYVNGIALGILELKSSVVSVNEGIRQNIANQSATFVKDFFATVQLILAGNDTEGVRYGTTDTPASHYLTWKEDDAVPTFDLLYDHLGQLCQKSRLLEIIYDFTIFDKGAKKLCRSNQYFGVKAAQPFIQRHEGGIIWHTQGSGKSLTMVWLAKWIRENNPHARVVIITDRIELDDQIEGVFKGVNEDIYRARSGSDLITVLNDSQPRLICSLVHKFGKKADGKVADDADVKNMNAYLEEIRKHIPPHFQAKGDIFVFVDECHRTQSGVLHQAMKEFLPNATFIGFTGTPLLKTDKKRSIEVFGQYIHTYRYDEAVADKVVLDLRYEARDIDQSLSSKQKVDDWFDAKTRGLTDTARAKIKARWGTLQKVLSSQSRIEKIVADIIFDMETKPRLNSGQGNAMLVCESIANACQFYQAFVDRGFTQSAIVTSYTPTPEDIKTEMTNEGYTERQRQYDIYMRMLNGTSPENFEKEAKRQFVDEPARMKLLIVVDKLLTGFDAPPATYLYIDKKMQDHGLFQAICRVNRVHDENKDYGYIIDYRDLFHSLEQSVQDYTSGAFENFDRDDVAGLLSDRLTKAKEHLDETLEQIRALCEPVANPKDSRAYLAYFSGTTSESIQANAQKRATFYKIVSSLIRAYTNIANEMLQAGYTATETDDIRQEVTHYEKVRDEIQKHSGDWVDMKLYEPAMRQMIDMYIQAQESVKVSSFDDMTLVELIVKRGTSALVSELPKGIREDEDAVAETIENNLRRVIIDEHPVNPAYYQRMSELLDNLIQQRKNQALAYEDYLAQVGELAKQVDPAGQRANYPKSINSPAKRALYDNLDRNETLALALDEEIRHNKPDGWRENIIKIRGIRKIIANKIDDEELVEKILELIRNQAEY